ncbi:spermidine synthase [Flavobacterium sp. '19STA2R22 D10 B1']|uniref:spermidine synthase n=1 Tax=Flavobacterium aerium TaxID=3037261 RepID=UPI00278C09E2|nr:fused MFS/spermidine synthase [Flavobacterium sp. '19STA2R22 D10 B1']
MLKKWLSYLIPIRIYQKKSTFSKNLEVTWNNGKLVLDSQNTNYSYGSLQRVLKKGLQTIGYSTIIEMEHILVLGVAGGSVIQTLINDIQYKGKITGIEIDENIITIANEYFHLDSLPNVEIVIDDASLFVFKTKDQYDLIIIDIFQDTQMPHFLFETSFIEQTSKLVRPKGYILFNTMNLTHTGNNQNSDYISHFISQHYMITRLAHIEQFNELLIVEKK